MAEPTAREESTNQVGREEASSIVPWSCRETFTQGVCGFPGAEHGCSRYESLRSGAHPEISYIGVPPAKREDDASPRTWLILRHRERLDIELTDRLPSAGEKEYVAFGFNGSELQETPIPVSMISPLSGWEIDRTRRSDSTPERNERTLSDVFGRDAFSRIVVPNSAVSVSLAGLIDAYLDLQCRFRGGETGAQYGREAGIALCKLQMNLARNRWLERSAVNFTYVDPRDFRVRAFDHLVVQGKWTGLQSSGLISAYNGIITIDDLSQTGSSGRNSVSFADCLCSKGRQNILPSEVAESFTRFRIGELVAYVIHWLLLGIFAHEDDLNRAFVNHFRMWRETLDSNDPVAPGHFAELLSLKVVVAPDPNVVRMGSAELEMLDEQSKHHLGMFQVPIEFRNVLATFGLSGDGNSWNYRLVSQFLRQELSSYLQLPMYEHLGWQLTSTVKRTPSKAAHADEDRPPQISGLEDLIAHFAFASGLGTSREAQAERILHVRRCVFPMGHVLTHWPGNADVTDYLVFPIWEELLQVNRAEPQAFRPVIFAHVFANITSSVPTPGDRDLLANLQATVLPFGHSIAHSYYREISRVADETQVAWEQASAWAHEVKNYCGPVVDTMSTVINSWNVTGSQEQRERVNHARRAILILNACSFAIQLALSNRVGDRLKRPAQQLRRLEKKTAKEIVATVFEYLLHYRCATPAIQEEMTITWSPARDSATVLQELLSYANVQNEDHIFKNPQIIWIIALLRELVWNIRNIRPVRMTHEKGSPPRIEITFNVTAEKDAVVLDVRQQQHEVQPPKPESIEKASGIESANRLFGNYGAGFGWIESKRPECVRVSDEFWRVTYHSIVRFLAVDNA